MRLLHEIKGIAKNPGKVAIMAIFYALILLVSFLIGKAFSVLVFSQKGANILLALLIAAVYFLLLVFCYSVLKLLILDIVSKNRISRKTLTNLGGFFWFNLVLFIIATVIFLLIGSFITYSLNNAVIAGSIFVVVFGVFCYLFVLFSQFDFIENHKILKSLRNGIGEVFSKKFVQYLKVLLFNVIVLGLYILLFYLIGALYNLAFIKNNENPVGYISFYNWIFNVLIVIIFLILLGFNIFLIKKIKE